MKYYEIILNRVIDGDSFDIDIHLGFGVWLKDQRLRLLGVDTPESRTSNEEERIYGNLAKEFVFNWCKDRKLKLVIEDNADKDKFGRILGNLCDEKDTLITIDIVENHHGVFYNGENKDSIKQLHLLNRQFFK